MGIFLSGQSLPWLQESHEEIDWIQIIPEHYMVHSRHEAWSGLQPVLERGLPIVSHGDFLSVGSLDPLDEDYLRQLEILYKRIRPLWHSDHLGFSGIDHVMFPKFMALPRTWETVRQAVRKIRMIQERFDIPFLLEPLPTYNDQVPQVMTEAQFVTEIVERADCGLFLNALFMSHNVRHYNWDYEAFLAQIPLERVLQVHAAGFGSVNELIIRQVLKAILKKTDWHGIVLQHAQQYMEWPDVWKEYNYVREILDEIGRERTWPARQSTGMQPRDPLFQAAS